MSSHADRLAALRAQLAADRLDGFVVPLSDEHLSEYVGGYAQRLAWLTGFEGSAGSAVVLPAEAAMFVDGRYTLQVRQQVSDEQWSFQAVPETSVAEWLGRNAPDGARIGYDPWLHSGEWVRRVEEQLASRGASLVPVERNPIDRVWSDRPEMSAARLIVHPERLAGRSSAAKRRDIAEWLAANRADAVVLAALDSVAWTLNLRGSDVPRTPVALAFAMVHADSSADLFVAPEKLDDDVRAHLGEDVRVHDRSRFEPFLEGQRERTVALDPERSVVAITRALERGGATIFERRDPTVLPRAIKNQAEIAGHKAAQRRDGVALARFLHWLGRHAPGGELDELTASDRLEALRREAAELRDLSFDTISGAGPNGAIVHYRASPATNRRLEPGSLYLVDSGGQYEDGTTDITRTVAIGAPSAEMRDRFTRVLKGHVALATVRFPKGTRGSQLDGFARRPLWEVGLDYAHGTGHGVGSYLSVHEGPQRISPFAGSSADEPLAAGMIVSNEPGYYKAGHYGIRIENLVLVTDCPVAGAEKTMLAFETLTLAPIDRTLIDLALIDPAERRWIDDYHARVAREIGPLLENDVRSWLEQACAPL